MSHELGQLEKLVLLGRESLLAYSHLSLASFESARHLRHLASKLEAVERGEIKRLMVFMPPRHGKSYLCSQFFPAWYMGRNPDKYIVTATYGQELADDFGRKVRNQVACQLHAAIFPECQLAGDSKAASRFGTSAGGQFFGVGVGGPLTGRGAHLALIDDPVRNRQDAESMTIRQRIKDWYQSVLYTRLMPGGAVILIMTRWHNDDLGSWLQREHAHEGWHVVNFPAIAEDEDALGRKAGEALWPQRYDVEALNRIKAAVGSRDFLALYQQRPVEQGGGIFKRDNLRFYVTKDKLTMARPMNRYILVDPARTRKKTSDFTAMAVIGLHTDGNYYVLDMVYDKLTLKQRGERLISLHRKWKPLAVGYKATGHEGDIDYMTQAMGAENYRFSIIPVQDTTDKAGRIMRLAPEIEEHRWWFPEVLHKTSADGEVVDLIEQFKESELEAFPAGVHDDMLDCLAGIHQIDTKWPKAKRSNGARDNHEAQLA